MKWFNSHRAESRETIAALYGMIVAQARSAALYRDFGVPDTVNGRFDMVVLHLAVFLHRLKDAGAEWTTVSQGVFDEFCLDMDDNLRELGIGDLKVPRAMRRVGSAFYGRVKSYDAALSEPGSADLASALSRNIFEGEQQPAAERLAAYVRSCVDGLARQDTKDFVNGIRFPDPANSVAA